MKKWQLEEKRKYNQISMQPTFMVSFTDETGNTIKVKIEIKIDFRYQRQDNQYIL